MDNKIIKLSFVGDILCEIEQNIGRNNKSKNYYDYTNIFENISDYLRSSDYVIGNLETPIAGKKLKYTDHKWSFNTPEEFVKNLKKSGFDLVSTANNHCLDRGIDGLKNTLKVLDKYGISHIGTYRNEQDRKKVFIKEINGIKVSFIAYTYGTNALFNKNYLDKEHRYCVNLFKRQEYKINKYNIFRRGINKFYKGKLYCFQEPFYLRRVTYDIDLAKRMGADYIVICIHSGGQYNDEIDQNTRFLFDYISKKGVNAIIGCHPHVLQECRFENHVIKAYSLGNFLTMSGVSIEPFDKMAEYAAILNIYLEKINNLIKIRDLTFSITKSIKCKEGSKIELLFDLINECPNIYKKEKLIRDNNYIISKFSNSDYNNKKIKKEYSLIAGKQ